jgi:hypothetical protein
MLYREIIAVCSEISTKHINALCGQKVEFWNFEAVVHAANVYIYNNTMFRELILFPFSGY